MQSNPCNGKEFVLYFCCQNQYCNVEIMVNTSRLRGWVSADTVHDEFTKLKNHNTISTGCLSCTDHSIECQHSWRTKFCDKIKELKQNRILKPFILVLAMNFFLEFSIVSVWRSYLFQVVKAYGIPLDANFALTILSAICVAGTCCFLFNVTVCGKRRLYLFSGTMVVLFCIAMSKVFFLFERKETVTFL